MSFDRLRHLYVETMRLVAALTAATLSSALLSVRLNSCIVRNPELCEPGYLETATKGLPTLLSVETAGWEPF